MEGASAFQTWFQPGPRPAWDAFNHGGFINQELTLEISHENRNEESSRPKPVQVHEPERKQGNNHNAGIMGA